MSPIIKRNPVWIKFADKFDDEINKIIELNPRKWMTLQIEVNQETWDIIKNIPEDLAEKLTLLEYLEGYTFKMIRMKEIKVIKDESITGEHFQIQIIKKS